MYTPGNNSIGWTRKTWTFLSSLECWRSQTLLRWRRLYKISKRTWYIVFQWNLAIKENQFTIEGFDSLLIPRPSSLSDYNFGKRGHGGKALFYKANLKPGIEILDIDKSGILWVKLSHTLLSPRKRFICFIFVYILTKFSLFQSIWIWIFWNLRTKKSLYSDNGGVLIFGYLNARCGERPNFLTNNNVNNRYIPNIESNNTDIGILSHFSMDKTVNTSGIILLDLCLISDIKIINGRFGNDSGEGNFTFMSTNGSSLIDYALCNHNFVPYITDFVVHEPQTCSSHVPIQLNISAKCSVKQTTNENTEFKGFFLIGIEKM